MGPRRVTDPELDHLIDRFKRAREAQSERSVVWMAMRWGFGLGAGLIFGAAFAIGINLAFLDFKQFAAEQIARIWTSTPAPPVSSFQGDDAEPAE